MQLEHLGPYRIGRTLGRGGMGTVYAGVQGETGQPAAIKVLSAAMAGDVGFRERFEAEIESLRLLQHPNIVRLFGFGEQDGHLFYAMELVEGRSLEDELHAGREFDWRQVCEIGIQVCRALKHAHDRGVIHRDIKPANLLLASDSEVKLSDFGIAKLFGNTGMTSDGGVLGTAEYMAPEQADGRAVTHRCDLYSLGGVLYALLAGRPPFRATNLLEMLQLQRFAEPEPVRRFAPETPVEFGVIIGLLLEKDPERRLPTAMVLGRRLESMRQGLSVRENIPAPEAAAPALDTDFAVEARAEAARDENAPSMEEPGATRGEEEYKIEGVVPIRGSSKFMRAARSELHLESELARTALDESRSNKVAPAEPDPPLVVAPPARRFTQVDADEQRRLETVNEPHTVWISWQTLALALSIAGVGLCTWYFLQPPSADTLFNRIEQVALEAQVDGRARLEDAQADIQTFLNTYHVDPRRKKLAEYQNEIDDFEAERKFAARLKKLTRAENLGPLERAYMDAHRQVDLDMAIGLRKLQAFLDLYDDGSDESSMNPCVLNARRQIVRLRKQVQEQTSTQLATLGRQLQRANDLARSKPQAAIKIWSAIVEIYGDKAWAREPVEQARARLSATVDAPTQDEP